MSGISSFLGFTSQSCEESRADWYFSVEPVVFKVSISSGNVLDVSQLGFELATHRDEALAERYLNCFFFCFFCGLECVGHSFAYVAHL
jgi:hypothetical protein